MSQSIFRDRRKAIDNHSGRLIGYFPDGVFPRILAENQGFVVSQPGRLLNYGLPLRRNWSWLIGWLFISAGRSHAGARRLAAAPRFPESVGRMRLKRIIILLLLVAWTAVISTWWLNVVPIKPACVIALAPNEVVVSLTEAGQLVTAFKTDSASRATIQGPLQFRQLPSPRIVRTFDVPEGLQSPTLRGENRLTAVVEGRLRLYDTSTKQMNNEVPKSDAAGGAGPTALDEFPEQSSRVFFIDPDLSRAVHQQAGRVVLRDVVNHAEISAIENAELFRVTSNFILAWRIDAETRRRPKNAELRIFDLRDLTPVDRFDWAGPILDVLEVANSPYVGIHTKAGTMHICERQTGRGLWKSPEFSLFFSSDGTELYRYVGGSNGVPHVVRRRASDGEVLTGSRPSSMSNVVPNSIVQTSASGVVVETLEVHPPFSQLFDRLVEWLSWFRGKTVALPRLARISRIVEVPSARIVGRLPEKVLGRLDSSNLLIRSKWVAAPDPQRVAVYSIPPNRDWWWLIGWLFIPPVGLAIVREVVRRGVRRWRLHHTNRNDSALGATR